MTTRKGACALLTPAYRDDLFHEAVAESVISADATCAEVAGAHANRYAEFGYDLSGISADTTTPVPEESHVLVDVIEADGSGFGTFIYVPDHDRWLLDDITLPGADSNS